MFQNRLASLTSVVDNSRSDLDAALSDLSVAIGEVQRFVAGSREQTSEQIRSLASVTQNLVDNRLPLENVLHVAPNAIANYQNIYYPPSGGVTGAFSFVNFANPVWFVCGMIGGVANTTAPETAKLCEQYLGPALRLLNFNNLPLPINPYLRPTPKPEDIIYTDPKLAPGGAGPGDPPEPPPAVSAYTGTGDVPPPPGYGGVGLPAMPPGLYGHDEVAATPSPALFPRRTDPGTAQHPSGPGSGAVGSGHAASADPGACRAATRAAVACGRDAAVMIRRNRVKALVVVGVLPRPDDDGLCLPGAELAAAARCGRPRARRGDLHRPGPECRHAGVEFAGHDRRRRRRQRRQDDSRRLARESRGVGQTRCGDTGERRCLRGADQPAGVDASGAEPAAGRSAERSSATGCHPRLEPVVDLSHHRADAVFAVDHRQRGRAGPDRRHHPQLQRRGVGTRARDPRAAHSARRFRRNRWMPSATTSSSPSSS